MPCWVAGLECAIQTGVCLPRAARSGGLPLQVQLVPPGEALEMGADYMLELGQSLAVGRIHPQRMASYRHIVASLPETEY